jgi:hypothetical protein
VARLLWTVSYHPTDLAHPPPPRGGRERCIPRESTQQARALDACYRDRSNPFCTPGLPFPFFQGLEVQKVPPLLQPLRAQGSPPSKGADP